MNKIDVKNKENQDWQGLTAITNGQTFVVERVRLVEKNIAIEGSFELPDLAKLSLEDQVFVGAFIRTHGSIKEMEQIFGVSYPTIKSRLNRISEKLEFVEINPRPTRSEIINRLQRGEITAQEAIKALEEKS